MFRWESQACGKLSTCGCAVKLWLELWLLLPDTDASDFQTFLNKSTFNM
jgi:hypothetical protein